MLKGIDISQHQAETPPLDGLAFAVARASIGSVADSRYEQHRDAFRHAGLVSMAYHYNGPTGSDIGHHVERFLELAGDADFLWLDQETFSRATATRPAVPGYTNAEAQAFIDGVRAAGRPCGLYHQASGYKGVDADALWIADWRATSVAAGYPRTTSSPMVEIPGWDLWQHRGDPLDLDVLNPATPLASLLRRRYASPVTFALALRQLEEAEAQVEARDAGIASRDAEIAKLGEALDDFGAELATVRGELAQAPAKEAERVALAAGHAEANRIRSAAGYAEVEPPRELSRWPELDAEVDP